MLPLVRFIVERDHHCQLVTMSGFYEKYSINLSQELFSVPILSITDTLSWTTEMAEEVPKLLNDNYIPLSQSDPEYPAKQEQL